MKFELQSCLGRKSDGSLWAVTLPVSQSFLRSRITTWSLSTSAMMKYAKESPADKFLIVTECGLSDRLLLEVPEKHFYKACKLCRYMKMITLDGTLDSLKNLRYEIELPEEVREGAKRALERMLELGA